MTGQPLPSPRPTALVSVRLITADVARLTAFYEDVTGLPARWSTPDFSEVDTPVGRLAIGSTATVPHLAAGSAAPAPGHRAIIEFRVEDVDGVHARLEAQGTPLVSGPTTMPWGNRSLLLRDPDGNLVNLFTPLTAEAVARSVD